MRDAIFASNSDSQTSVMYVPCILSLLCFLATATAGNVNDVTEWKIDDLGDGACKTDLQDYVNALTNSDIKDSPWALQMLDASAKIPNGILSFNRVHMGMFEECLGVVHPVGSFQGKHCMLSINLLPAVNEPSTPAVPKILEIFFRKPEEKIQPRQSATTVTLQYGLCVPSTCSAQDLNTVFGNSSKIVVDDDHCWTSEEKPLSDLAIAFICVSAVLAGLTVVSTCYHYVCVYKNCKPKRVLCAFSLYLNVPKLFEIRANDADNMGCLHGIRTMSMMWVMLCHSFAVSLTSPVINTSDIGQLMNELKHIPISNGFVSVDSFFFMSGLLVAFVFFRNIGRSGSYDAISSYIHRYIRLTPPLAMMIFAMVAMIPETGKGPMWYDSMWGQIDDCKQHWWKTLIYLQNYISPEVQCLGQSWYLTADMQMFWIAPLILYPILLWPTYGMAFLGLLTVASTSWTFALAYVNDYKASMLIMVSQDQFNYDYVATHTRITPWLVGLACGVGICAIKARKITIRLSKPVVLAGWCASTVLSLGILFSFHRFQVGPEAPTLDAAFYLSFTRLGWGIGLAWIVFACIHGYGGVINSFLSLGIWQPLGKLSYCVFLTHMTVLIYRAATLQTNVYLSDLNVVYEFCATLMLSYLISLVLYLTVEAPFVIMDQEFFGSVTILQYPKPQKTQVEKVEEGIREQ